MFALIPLGVLGVLLLVAMVFLQRGRDGLDLTPRTLMRVYLYIASLAGIVVLVIGLSSMLDFGLSAAFGRNFVYGSPPSMEFARPCPPNEPSCPQPEERARQMTAQRDRQQSEDLLRGITFTSFGALFWGAHWWARRRIGAEDEAGSSLRRSYLMVGTVMFGLATVILVPTGVYQALSNAILTSPDTYRPGVDDSLSTGLVTLPVWLIYLSLVVRDTRRGERVTAAS